MKKVITLILLVILALSPLLAAFSWNQQQSGTSSSGRSSGRSSTSSGSQGNSSFGSSNQDTTTYATDSSEVGKTLRVKTTLSAGKAGGVFVGFSNTAAPDIENITEVALTFEQPTSMSEIVAKDEGNCFAYWIFKPMDSNGFSSNYSVYLSWSDSEGHKGSEEADTSLFKVYSDNTYSTELSYGTDVPGYKLADITKGGTSSVFSSQQIFIKTGDLRQKIYGEKYTLTLKLEVKTT